MCFSRGFYGVTWVLDSKMKMASECMRKRINYYGIKINVQSHTQKNNSHFFTFFKKKNKILDTVYFKLISS